MSFVYKAIDLELNGVRAVKILRPSLTNDPAALTRFYNEARSVASLNHPNIVTVYDVGHDGPIHFIVMEFIEGKDLKQIIHDGYSLILDDLLRSITEICYAIGFAHRVGLIHADVKPQNILIPNVKSRDLRPGGYQRPIKVTDFGIAQAFNNTSSSVKSSSELWGSPQYFSPEQARGEQLTPAADVYSIGITVFELLTGILPYQAKNKKNLALAHIENKIPLVTEYNPYIPEKLSLIVHKTMDKDPVARYQTADQLAQVLESYRRSLSPKVSNTIYELTQGISTITLPFSKGIDTTQHLPSTQIIPSIPPSQEKIVSPISQDTKEEPVSEMYQQKSPSFRFGKQPRVFISYRRVTSAMLANLLSARLSKDYKMLPYLDTERLDIAGQFPVRLTQAIRYSDAAIFLLADKTLESEWVRHEIKYAYIFNKILIPVFQESYIQPNSSSFDESINALLKSDGVHIFDVKNVYINEAIEKIAHMIKTTIAKKRRK